MKLMTTVLTLVFFLTWTGCLKTRTQLRDGGDDVESNPVVPAKAVQDVPTDGRYAVDEMKSEMTQLEGRLEDLERGFREMDKDQKDLVAKTKDIGPEALTKLNEHFSHVEDVLSELADRIKKLEDASVMADPAQVWEQARKDFKQEDYSKALESLTIYTKNTKVKNYQDAVFMKGQCFYKLKEYKKAIVEFSKFPEHFSKTARMPEALYQIALSFEALGMKDDAHGFYQEILEKFPKSPEAKKTRKKKKR